MLHLYMDRRIYSLILLGKSRNIVIFVGIMKRFYGEKLKQIEIPLTIKTGLCLSTKPK